MPVREGFHTITPYLTAPDADALVAFIQRALGGVETLRTTGGAGGAHIELRSDRACKDPDAGADGG